MITPPTMTMTTALARPDQLLRTRAQQLEGQFLAEMLGHAGLDGATGPFSGGIGEEQFASFLREAHATALARAGGIGLAEHLFNASQGRPDAAG